MRTIKKLEKIFKLLGKQNYKTSVSDIIQNNETFFESFFATSSPKQIIDQLKKPPSISTEAIQLNSNEKQQCIHIIHKYEDLTKYVYLTSDNHSLISIFIKKKSGYAYLDQQSFHENSTLYGLIYSEKNIILFSSMITYLQNNKNSLDIDRVILIDTSFKTGRDYKLPLCNLHTLMYGDTFYGMYNFRPCSIESNKHYIENKQKMNTIKVSDISRIWRYVFSACTYEKMSEESVRCILDSLAEFRERKCLLSEYIRHFIKNYDTNWKIFTHFVSILTIDIELVDLHGEAFYQIL